MLKEHPNSSDGLEGNDVSGLPMQKNDDVSLDLSGLWRDNDPSPPDRVRETIKGSDIDDNIHIVTWLRRKNGELPLGLPSANAVIENLMKQCWEQHGSNVGFPTTEDVKRLLNHAELKNMQFCVKFQGGRKIKLQEDGKWRKDTFTIFDMQDPSDAELLVRWFKSYLKHASEPGYFRPSSSKGAATVLNTSGKRKRKAARITLDLGESSWYTKHVETRKSIGEGQSMDQLLELFGHPDICTCLERLERAFLIPQAQQWEEPSSALAAVLKHREDTANRWAVALFSESMEEADAAKRLSEDNATLELFLFRLVDLAKGDVTAITKLETGSFPVLIYRIAVICLVMSRSYTLLRSIHPRLNRKGQNWFADNHLHLMRSIGAIPLDSTIGFESPTIDWRYQWLMEVPKLPMVKQDLSRWIQPALSPIVAYPQLVVDAAKAGGKVIVPERHDSKLAAV